MKSSELNKLFEIFSKNDGDQIGCVIANDFDLDTSIIAGAMISIIEAVLNQLPDSKQIEFEQQVVELFKEMLEHRHEYTYREVLEDDEDEEDEF